MSADLRHIAQPGARIAVRVQPGARRDQIEVEGDLIRIRVTAPPEGGKANAAVVKLLSKALGVAKTRLSLVRGAASRDKLFQLD